MDKDVDPLKCQVVGCENRWTINMGWKKCSKHAWSKDGDYDQILKPKFTQPPTKPFTEIDDDEPY